MLAGHLEPQKSFLDAWASGRIHHAWLLAGPTGIGKRTFADAAAAHVLASAGGPPEGIAADRLAVSPEHRIAKLIAAGSHLDRRVLTREERDSGGLAANISVDQVRSLQPIFRSTPGLSPWRVVIVDAIDDMNRAAANAFLKNLEEPPANTLFLLISHAPGRLLPTIRSRCRILRFQPLSQGEVREVLTGQLPESDPREIETLAALSEGSPGRALRFAGLDIDGLQKSLADLAGAAPSQRQPLALALAKSLAGKTAQPRYEAFLELAPAFLAEKAQRQTGRALARTLERWERAHTLGAQAQGLSLDAQSVTYELANLVASAEG
ncbi:DNA polymerase III subunit delta' [Sphingoaurantiacus capsulatus]|uniref:DNA polymerase III subunit delta n=1 Tax=Sphingoaurantiacus capsulatus TaxID=1771310 RepID=A0ABV7XG22_9SPHN